MCRRVRHIKWILITVGLGLCLQTPRVWAFTAPHIAHPLDWMHYLPGGEDAGWVGSWWLNAEVNHANIWNTFTQFKNVETGRTLDYFADFEQTSLILELGKELTSSFAVALELPVSTRWGGFLDGVIAGFHDLIGGYNFQRETVREDGMEFAVGVDGVTRTTRRADAGLSNLKLKLKFWPWQVKSASKIPCPCGFGIDLQVKAPLEDAYEGMTSGGWDYSFLMHFGLPLGSIGAMSLTGGATYLGDSKIFKDWPRMRWIPMMEVGFDLGGETWGLLLGDRFEGPFMDEHKLSRVDAATDEDLRYYDEIASSWRALTAWRNYLHVGVRVQINPHVRLQFVLTEDMAFGALDKYGAFIQVDNSPDIAGTLQLIIR